MSRSSSPRATPIGPKRARFLPQIAQTCTRLGEMVYQAVSEDKLPLVLGGDHSVAVGTVAGIARAYREKRRKDRTHLDRCARRHEHARNHRRAAMCTACRWPAASARGRRN